MRARVRLSFIAFQSLHAVWAQYAAREDRGELRDDFVVADSEVPLAAEKFLDKKVVEELHVGRRESDRRVNPFVQTLPALQVLEVTGVAIAHTLG